MSKFTVTEYRKPWNKSAEWLYKKCVWISDKADSIGINTVQEFADYLQQEARANYIPTGNIDIDVWTTAPGIYCCGIDKKNSTNRAAVIISLATEKEVSP